MQVSGIGGNVGVPVRARRMLYSRGQIALAVFLAGPLPPLYMLISNLRALGQAQLLPVVVVTGYTLMMVEMVAIWFIPSHTIAAALIPATNLALATTTLLAYQPERTVITGNGDYVLAPAWRVAWVCVARLLEFAAWFIGVAVVFYILGIEKAK